MGRTLRIVAVCVAVTAPEAAGPQLSSEAAARWQAYIAATETRVTQERREAIPRRPGVERGEVFIEQLHTRGPAGDLEVPDAIVHHWRGTVLVPGARLDEVMSRLEHEPPDTRQEDVVSSSILEQGPGRLKVAIRVRRKLILSAVFDTEHECRFERESPTLASSSTVATRIVEIADVGTPQERPKRPDEDRGLLWRWNSYWRYDQVEQGVLVECESITLSRTVPLMLRPVAGPLISHVARESMDRTLVFFRERFASPRSSPAPGQDRK